MAIVKMTNNVETITVPGGSVEVYESLGFHVVGKKQKSVEPDYDAEAVDEDADGEDADVDDEEVAIFLDAVLQVPVDKWTKEDVKKFIQIKSIDASGAKKPHEYKALIKEYLESADTE